MPGLRRRCPFAAPSRGSLPQRAGAGDSRLCTSSNGTHGSPSRAAPQLELGLAKRSRPMVPANDESPDSEQPGGTDGSLAYVYRALGLHRTPPRAPKGCRLDIGRRPLGARAPSLFETSGSLPRDREAVLNCHPGQARPARRAQTRDPAEVRRSVCAGAGSRIASATASASRMTVG